MKFAKDPYWKKSGFYTISQRVANILFGFGSFYLLVRILSKVDFGTWALYITVTSLIEIARNGLVQNALIKFAASSDKKDYPTIISSALVLNIITTVFSILLLFSIAGFLSVIWSVPQLAFILYLYTITTLFLLPVSQLNGVQQANLDFKGVFYTSLVRQGLFFVAVLIIWYLDYTVELYQLAVVQILAAFLGSLTCFLFAKKYLHFTRSVDWKRVKELFNYGKFVFGTNISAMIFNGLDQMIIGIMLNPVAVALYNIVLRIINVFEVPLSSISAIVFPQSSKRSSEQGKEAVKYLYERSVGLLIGMIIPVVIGTLLFAKEIIWFIAGEKYFDAIPILQVAIFIALFMPYQRQFGVIMDSIGKAKVNFLTILITTLINIITDYLFISAFGVIGAAYGTLSAMMIAFVFTQIILHKEINTNPLNTFIYAWKFYTDGMKMVVSKLSKK